MSRESLFVQNIEMKLHCTTEPDLLDRNRPEDSYLTKDVFYRLNVKVCEAGKMLGILLWSQRTNKGIVNVRKQAIHNFKLLCCQLPHIIMYP